MRLLLDTHIALWAVAKRSKLPEKAVALISDPDNEIVVSAASVWEVSIKHALTRLGGSRIAFSGGEALRAFLAAGYEFLPITAEHAAAVDALPPIHRDPFDRMLAAQAITEPLRLLTHDPVLARYSALVIQV